MASLFSFSFFLQCDHFFIFLVTLQLKRKRKIYQDPVQRANKRRASMADAFIALTILFRHACWIPSFSPSCILSPVAAIVFFFFSLAFLLLLLPFLCCSSTRCPRCLLSCSRRGPQTDVSCRAQAAQGAEAAARQLGGLPGPRAQGAAEVDPQVRRHAAHKPQAAAAEEGRKDGRMDGRKKRGRRGK